MRTVLLVEDDVDLRRLFRTALSLAGFRLLEAGDGLAALNILDTEPPPDIVVLDIGLPIVSGHLVREEIAAHAHLRKVPVVIVTGTEIGEVDSVACILKKPVAPDELVRTVERCLAESRFQGP